MVQTLLINTSNLLWKDVEMYLHLLNASEAKQIISIRHEKSRIASLMGRLILLYYLKKNKILIGSKITSISYTECGKPYLSEQKLNFSISHSNNYVGCTFSLNSNIGLDIEYMNDIDICEYKSVFGKDEYSYLMSNQSLYAFYLLWTRKESFLKAIGAGFLLQPQNINTLENPIIYEKYQFYTKSWNICGNYLMTIASANLNQYKTDILELDNLCSVLNY